MSKDSHKKGRKRGRGSDNNRTPFKTNDHPFKPNLNNQQSRDNKPSPFDKKIDLSQKISSSNNFKMQADSAKQSVQKLFTGNKGNQILSERRISYHLASKPSTSFTPVHIDTSKREGSLVANVSTAVKKIDDKSPDGNSLVPLPNPGLFDVNIVGKYLKWQKLKRVGPGLYNNGNSCFLNSTLQCLFHTPVLAQVLVIEPNLALKTIASRESNLVVSNFQRLMSEVWTPNSSTKSLMPKLMLRDLKRVGKHFRHMRQEDAHEYLIHLLDCMHEEVLKVNGVKLSDGKIAETTFISRIFGGYFCNQLKCSKCKYTSKSFNHFLDLSLDINGGVNSIESAIASFTKPEVLSAGNEWKCEGCKNKVQAVKQMTIHKAPAVLIFQLKRFSFGNMFGKVKKHLDFGTTIEVPCDTGELKSSSGPGKSSFTKYELIGLIVHHGGSVHSGHYVAFVKAPNMQWYEMNDSTVSQVSLKTVLSQQAYILFYSKISSLAAVDPVVPTAQKEPSVTATNPKNTAESMAVTSGATLASVTAPSSTKKPSEDLGIVEKATKLRLVPQPVSASLSGIPIPGPPNSSSATLAAESPSFSLTSLEKIPIPVQAVETLTEPTTKKIRLRVKMSWKIPIFRFVGPIYKLKVWRAKRKLRQSCSQDQITSETDDIVPGDNSEEDQEQLHQAQKFRLMENFSKLDEGSESLVQSGENRLSQNAIAIPSTSVAKALKLQSTRGKTLLSEGHWDGVDDDSLIEKYERASQQVEAENQKLLAARQTSEHDKLLDQGRTKKVKVKKYQARENVPYVNEFQKFHDRRMKTSNK